MWILPFFLFLYLCIIVELWTVFWIHVLWCRQNDWQKQYIEEKIMYQSHWFYIYTFYNEYSYIFAIYIRSYTSINRYIAMCPLKLTANGLSSHWLTICNETVTGQVCTHCCTYIFSLTVMRWNIIFKLSVLEKKIYYIIYI